jgi:hypothetical protein
MAVTAVINITQFEPEEHSASARDRKPSVSSTADVKDEPFEVTSSASQGHPPAVTQPAASNVAGGWTTPSPETVYWSDSPINKPYKLYRRRLAFGRDERELFPNRGLDPLSLLEQGERWGKLDDNCGILTYQQNYGLDSEQTVLEFQIHNTSEVRDLLGALDSDVSVKESGIISSDVTLQIYPFLTTAIPAPNSVKNQTDTDIYIRLGNFTHIFDPDTIVLYIDGAIQPELEIEEFFSGLGGFDVTWNNAFAFEYDARVDVRWELSDKSVPSNQYVISYPFYTVPDTSGPRITNLIPDDLDVDVPIQSAIQFDVEDYENDVDIDTLILYVNNVKVVDGVTGTLEITRFQNLRGYTVKYTHNEPWLYGDLIPVAIFITDTAKNPNTTFYVYSFTTVESLAPRLINLKPLACTIAVPVGTHISADVIDGGHGVDKDSIVFTVEDIERSGQIALIPIVHRDE